VLAALVLAPLGLGQEARAATTIGSDLSGAPISACASVTGCTAANLSGSGSRPITAPSGGVVVRFRIKHGPATPGATYTLKVLSGSGAIVAELTSFALERQLAPIQFDNFATGETDVVQPLDGAGRPQGIPIASGQRIGVFVPGGIGFQGARAGYAVAEHDADHSAGTAAYTRFTGYEALVNADIEPDADGDRYGDGSQDNCPAIANDQTSNPCPSRPPAGLGTAPAQPVASGVPAGYARPRIGRLARTRRPLSSLSRKGIGVPITCHGPCAARGALVVRTGPGRAVTVGRGRRSSTSGGRFRLKLKLTRRGRRLLLRSRRAVRVSLRVSASDAWGRSSRRQRLVVTR
jgi:hypothetical protein